jgi:RNA polymerase sigma-70 factor (ECF subfamily)
MLVYPSDIRGYGGSCGVQDSQDSDEELIGRLAHGDLGALEALYTRYSRPIYSLALRILGDEGEAEEVTQDVFERAWRYAPSFDRSRGRLATWLLSMTHHVAIDAVRRRQRRPQSVTGEGGALALKLAPDPRVDVANTIHDSLAGAEIRSALRLLPEPQRQAIELAYFGGLSHLEIAATLGDPLGTVKARIRRGMERLRTVLADIGREGGE